MLLEPPLRQEFLLLTIGLAGPFDSTAKLQKTVYLAQAMSGTSQYDFKPNPYGAYSEDLDRDIMDNFELVSPWPVMPFPDYTKSSYSVKLTREGRKQLGRLKDQIKVDGKFGPLSRSLAKIKGMDKYALMEAVYSEFGPKSDIDHDSVNDSLRNLLPKVGKCYEEDSNHESTFVMSILEIIKECMPKLKDVPELQKTVVLHLAHELIQRIAEISDKLTPPINYRVVKPKILEISELEFYFRNYCDKKKIMKDLLKRSFDEMFTEEEIERIYRAYEKVLPP